MLDMKRITTYVFNRDQAVAKERELDRNGYDKLGYFQKKKLLRINNLIRNITLQITKESGWYYIPPYTFSCLSNFHYNEEEILFTVNAIENFKLRPNPSRLETDFFNKYKDLLEKLDELIKRKKTLIPIEGSKIIPIESIKDSKELKEKEYERSKTASRLKELGTEFMIDFQKAGVVHLVQLLNRLVTEPNPMKEYDRLQKEIKDPFLIQELLRWSALYTPRGEQILLERARKQSEEAFEKALEEPDQEVDNIIPFNTIK